jgi:hypothetical protein
VVPPARLDISLGQNTMIFLTGKCLPAQFVFVVVVDEFRNALRNPDRGVDVGAKRGGGLFGVTLEWQFGDRSDDLAAVFPLAINFFIESKNPHIGGSFARFFEEAPSLIPAAQAALRRWSSRPLD